VTTGRRRPVAAMTPFLPDPEIPTSGIGRGDHRHWARTLTTRFHVKRRGRDAGPCGRRSRSSSRPGSGHLCSRRTPPRFHEGSAGPSTAASWLRDRNTWLSCSRTRERDERGCSAIPVSRLAGSPGASPWPDVSFAKKHEAWLPDCLEHKSERQVAGLDREGHGNRRTACQFSRPDLGRIDRVAG
jgi:hypothetical protein